MIEFRDLGLRIRDGLLRNIGVHDAAIAEGVNHIKCGFAPCNQ